MTLLILCGAGVIIVGVCLMIRAHHYCRICNECDITTEYRPLYKLRLCEFCYWSKRFFCGEVTKWDSVTARAEYHRSIDERRS